MAKISDITEAKIKAAAKIEDVLSDQGVTLHRRGAQLVGLCPFHDDRSEGSFQVSRSKNICSCYACGAIGLNPIDTLIRLKYANLSEKEAYPAALRYLAAIYGIYVDDEEAPKVDKKAPITPPPPKRQQILWNTDLVTPFRQFNDRNPLLAYLRGLPLSDHDKGRLEKAIINYAVGTYPSGYHEGWTIWWLIDQLGYVRSGKMMKYKTDGHRDKAVNSTWVHTQLAKAGKYNSETHEPNLRCLFGQHLIPHCPDAVIRVVESEKTAVICSAFTDPKKALWVATGGMQRLDEEMLLPILNSGRRIELYPDYDGYKNWQEKIDTFELRHYESKGMLTISPMVKELWEEQDGPKADIADIMIRLVTTPPPSEDEETYIRAKMELGIKEHEGLRYAIQTLQLRF